MVETIFMIEKGREKPVQRVIQDENIHYVHMQFNKGEGLPEHFSNAPVYMTVLKGQLSIKLNDQEIQIYPQNTVLKIPVQTKMNVNNHHDELLELIVVKAPAPQ